jgi:poly(3-hydroxyalkanoate) synthetase
MTAQCRICGLLVGVKSVGMSAEDAFEALGLAAFLHLVQQHPEHVQGAINPLVARLVNYVASLALESSSDKWTAAVESARARLADWWIVWSGMISPSATNCASSILQSQTHPPIDL